MSSFSNKIYGKRSAENRKKKKLEKLAAAEKVVSKDGLTPHQVTDVNSVIVS
jgi:hypothetical protein